MIVTAAQILAQADKPRVFPGRKPKDKELLTTTRAARMLDVSAVHLTQLNQAGLIPRVRVGSAYKYRLADVRAYMDAS